MKQRVFVYATLRDKGILKKALGEEHGKEMTRTHLPGYVERDLHIHGNPWPTIMRRPGSKVPGYTFLVSEDELKKLDDWEDHYQRKYVHTEEGPAWSYMYKL